MTHPIYCTNDPVTENTEGSSFVTIQGKRYKVANVIHCINRENSDIRIWVPFSAPFKKTVYVYETVAFKDLTKVQQDRFFTLSARRSIWGKSLKA
jgi:hypothetical protein